jgi:hypothetical protein
MLRGLDAATSEAGGGWLQLLPDAAANAAVDCTLLMVTIGLGGSLLPGVEAGVETGRVTSAVSPASIPVEGNGFLGFPVTILCA